MKQLAPVVIASVFVAGVAAADTDHRMADAAKAQDRRGVQTLVKQHAEVNGAQGDGSTALHWAAHWDDRELVNALLKAGANPDAATDQGVTPLSLAALNGSGAVVQALLASGAKANHASLVGETPLMIAAHAGSVPVVTALVGAGAEIDAREGSGGQNALMFAVAARHADVVRVLLERGADPKARSKNQFTPLLFAAQQGDVEIARLLLDRGANVDEAAPDGVAGDTNAQLTYRTDTEAAALLVAIDSGHETMARFLLDRGADPNLSGTGRTALHSAVQQAMPDLVDSLLVRGADPNSRTFKALPLLSRFIGQQTGLDVTPIGSTPFWWAASYGDLRTMHTLIEWGADPFINTNDGTTPLMVAAGVDFVEGQDKYGRRWFTLDTTPIQERARAAVEYCLELGLDINASNNKGQTALHGAVYFGGTTLVPFMVQHGANMNAINKRGQTPWLITQGEYQAGSFIAHKEAGEVLQRLGADPSLGKDIGAEGVRLGGGR